MTTTDNISDFYIDTEPPLSDQAKAIFVEYSGIPREEIIPHIQALREKAWGRFKYPCIGRYGFLDFAIGDAPGYAKVLAQVKDGATLLDLGCCFGQDIRKLVYDGAPSENITGSDLDAGFIDLGYDLFRDKNKLKSTFKTGDFFAPEKAGLEDGSFDFVHASSFFHLFNLDEQADAIARCLCLLKRKPGSALFGRQVGTREPGNITNSQASRSGDMYRHDEESFAKMLREIAADLGIEVEVHVTQQEQQRIPEKNIPGVSNWWMQRFTVRLL